MNCHRTTAKWNCSSMQTRTETKHQFKALKTEALTCFQTMNRSTMRHHKLMCSIIGATHLQACIHQGHMCGHFSPCAVINMHAPKLYTMQQESKLPGVKSWHNQEFFLPECKYLEVKVRMKLNFEWLQLDPVAVETSNQQERDTVAVEFHTYFPELLPWAYLSES